jgi:hypothetical protein
MSALVGFDANTSPVELMLRMRFGKAVLLTGYPIKILPP